MLKPTPPSEEYTSENDEQWFRYNDEMRRYVFVTEWLKQIVPAGEYETTASLPIDVLEERFEGAAFEGPNGETWYHRLKTMTSRLTKNRIHNSSANAKFINDFTKTYVNLFEDMWDILNDKYSTEGPTGSSSFYYTLTDALGGHRIGNYMVDVDSYYAGPVANFRGHKATAKYDLKHPGDFSDATENFSRFTLMDDVLKTWPETEPFLQKHYAFLQRNNLA